MAATQQVALLPPIPTYLKGYASQAAKNPRKAASTWFSKTGFGLFIHYNNTSLLPGSKYDPMPEGVTPNSLSQRFRAEAFDADAIADLAVAAGARYICFTPYHGGGPYLWKSEIGHPNSTELPAKRDLVRELADACHRRGLGYFLYIHWTISESYDAVWERNQGLIRELGTKYGPIAGWWIDSSPHYHRNPEKYPRLAQTYALMRELQPYSLISFCEGVTGDEDYLTFEHRNRFTENATAATKLRASDKGKPVEVCTTLQLDQPGGSGRRMWFNVERAYHRNVDEAWEQLVSARRSGANLLLNTGLQGDGSIHPADEATLRALGKRLKARGLPPTR